MLRACNATAAVPSDSVLHSGSRVHREEAGEEEGKEEWGYVEAVVDEVGCKREEGHAWHAEPVGQHAGVEEAAADEAEGGAGAAVC